MRPTPGFLLSAASATERVAAFRFRAALAMWALAAVLCTTALFGQEDKQPEAKPAAADAAVVPAPESPEKPEKTTGTRRAEGRLIYLPYKNLRDVFDKEVGTVFMPYLQFLKLVGPTAAPSGKPPVAALITAATYTGRAEKDFARIQAKLTIRALAPAWAELPVRFGEAAVGKVTSADNKVLLRGTGNGTYTLLLPAAGEHVVELELLARIKTTPDGRMLDLECPPAAMTTFEFSVPAPDQTIEVSPLLIAAPVETDEESSRIKATLGATKEIKARWHPRVTTAPAMEFLAGVQNTIDVRIGDGAVHTQATLVYQVLRGELAQVQVAVPLGHQILDVSAPGLKGWTVANEEKRQVVTIELLSAEARNLPVSIHTERTIPGEPFELAGIDEDGTVFGIHAIDAVRESGLIAVGHASDLALTVEKQTGLVRVEAGEAPENLRRKEGLYYKFFNPRLRLQVSVKPVEPHVLVDHQTQFIFRDDELQLTDRLRYTVERAGIFELRLKLAEGLKIDSVQCEPMKEYQVTDEGKLLVISLKERTEGAIGVVVSAHVALKAEESESRKLPLPEPVDVSRETGTVFVHAPDSLEVATEDKGLVGAQPARSEAGRAPAVSGARLASAWSYTRRPVEIPVRVQRKPTRFTASVATRVQAQPDLVEVTTQLKFQVLYAGLDTFRFALPERVADNVQIESADPANVSIQQKTKDAEAKDGWVGWTVVLQREVTGTVPLVVRYDLKPEEKAGAAAFQIEPLRVLASPRKAGGEVAPAAVTGEVVVERARTLSLTAQPKELEPIDVRELTLLPQEGSLAYRYYRQPEKLDQPLSLEISATRHEIQDVVETIVSRALFEAVVGDSTSITYRCRYLLKTSERQRLNVDLPKSAELFDTLVAGKKVDLERNPTADAAGDWNSYFVNVSRKTPSDEPFVLSFEFRAPFRDKLLRGWGGELSIPLPRLGSTAPGAPPTVALQEVRAAIWVPREYALVGQPRHFSSDRRTYIDFLHGVRTWQAVTPELEQWFGDAGGGLFVFHPEGNVYQYRNLGGDERIRVRYWKMEQYTWVISGALLVIAFVLASTTWENKLILLLLGAFAAAMFAMHDPDEVIHGLAAARFGLAALIGVWLIHALARPRMAPPPEPLPPFTMGGAIAAVIPPPGIFEPEKPATPPTDDAS